MKRDPVEFLGSREPYDPHDGPEKRPRSKDLYTVVNIVAVAIILTIFGLVIKELVW